MLAHRNVPTTGDTNEYLFIKTKQRKPEQQHPNVFTTSLANIAPGENISIEFEYQQVLDYKDEHYCLRFPIVVGPRYHPTKYSLNKTNVYTKTDSPKNSYLIKYCSNFTLN